tara:strand:+ start:2035 stop:2991 length:957 start_codon:yes stop_codon:yes gene_type:complete
MFDIITIGSATVDTFIETDNKFFKGKEYRFPVGAKLLIKHVNIMTGGGATNTAVGFSRMGLKTSIISCIGVKNNSKRVIDELEHEKVDTSLIERNPNQRTGFSVILDAKGHDRTILAFKGSNNLLCVECLDNRRCFNTKWMYFTSLMGKSYNTLKKIAKQAHDKKIKIVFNPSLYLAKKGVKFLGDVLKLCNVVILNKEEAQALFKEKNVKKCLSKFHKLGVNIAVITDGGNKIHAYDGECIHTLQPPKVKVVETTGAGDAFSSGFVAALVKGKKLKDALSIGLANSQSVMQFCGAKEKLLTWKNANTIAKKHKVKIC